MDFSWYYILSCCLLFLINCLTVLNNLTREFYPEKFLLSFDGPDNAAYCVAEDLAVDFVG